MSVKNLNVDLAALTTDPLSKSAFTIKDLIDLNDPKLSYKLNLSVIGFIDLNAFFAQCEQIRLGLDDDAPVVCAQWQSLIAVSYPARKFGINRMDTIQSAKKKCPKLIIAHAAAFKKGEDHWLYVKGLPDQTVYKVSLDPYRRESRKIIKILKEGCDMVEKASVDESYMDFGRLVYLKILSFFPFLQDLVREHNPDTYLPPIPKTLPESLYWVGDIYKTPEEDAWFSESQAGAEPKPVINDWDDICLVIGSQILYDLRNRVFKDLGYTTSGGLARNKRLAKLAGGFIKPDMQTIVRNKLIHRFLNNFELIDITGMGGKTGDVILSKFDVPGDINSIKFLREHFLLDQLKQELPNDHPLAERVFNLVRGNYIEELVLRTSVKSMMSRKNFLVNAFVDNIYDTCDWLKVFVGDLYSRLIELDDENLNLSMLQLDSDREKGSIMRPKTISIQLTTSSYTKLSKQTPIPVSRSLEKLRVSMTNLTFRLLLELLENSNVPSLNNGKRPRLLKVTDSMDVLKNYKIMPLANLSVVISNFVKTTDSNLIDSYLGNPNNKGLLAKQDIEKMFSEVNTEQPKQALPAPIEKKSKKPDQAYVKKLFEDFQISENERKEEQAQILKSKSASPAPQFKEDKEYIKKLFDEFESSNAPVDPPRIAPKSKPKVDSNPPDSNYNVLNTLRSSSSLSTSEESNKSLLERLIRTRYCDKCHIPVEDVFEHVDLHYAMELSEKLNGTSNQNEINPKPESNKRTSHQNKQENPKKKKLDKGQTKLPF